MLLPWQVVFVSRLDPDIWWPMQWTQHMVSSPMTVSSEWAWCWSFPVFAGEEIGRAWIIFPKSYLKVMDKRVKIWNSILLEVNTKLGLLGSALKGNKAAWADWRGKGFRLASSYKTYGGREGKEDLGKKKSLGWLHMFEEVQVNEWGGRWMEEIHLAWNLPEYRPAMNDRKHLKKHFGGSSLWSRLIGR